MQAEDFAKDCWDYFKVKQALKIGHDRETVVKVSLNVAANWFNNALKKKTRSRTGLCLGQQSLFVAGNPAS